MGTGLLLGHATKMVLNAANSYRSALDYYNRTRELVEASRRRLHQSDAVLRWCETFGPLPPAAQPAETVVTIVKHVA